MFWRFPEYSFSSYLFAPVPRLLAGDLEDELFEREGEELERALIDLSSPDLMFMLEPRELSDLLFVLDREPTDLAPVDFELAVLALEADFERDLAGDFTEEDLEGVDLFEADRDGVDLDSSMSMEAMLRRPVVFFPVPEADRVAPLLRELFALLLVLVDLPPVERPVVDGLLVPAFLDAIWNLLSKITFVII